MAPFNSGIDFLIRDLRHELVGKLQRQLNPLKLYVGWWFALRALAEEDGITLRQLSRKIGLLDAAIGSTIDALEKRGLIRRIRDSEDRRKINVFLTEKGRKTAVTLGAYAERINDTLTQGFTAREVETFRNLLIRARKNLDDK